MGFHILQDTNRMTTLVQELQIYEQNIVFASSM